MKILAVGAGRQHGNSNTIIREILRGAESVSHEIKFYDLNQMDIKGCRGCYACEKTEYGCVIQDDLKPYWKDLMKADVLILGTPNYIYNISGQMKMLIDRHYSMKDRYYKPRLPKGKRGIYIFSQGDSNTETYRSIYETYVKYLESHGIETLKFWVYGGSIPAGEDTLTMKEAYELGKNL